ncbi:MAG: hypothetical protein ABI401_14730 [Candidatus Dormibacter sp.]
MTDDSCDCTRHAARDQGPGRTWRPDDHFAYQVGSTSRLRLESLEPAARDDCLRRMRDRLGNGPDERYLFRGAGVMAVAAKPASET